MTTRPATAPRTRDRQSGGDVERALQDTMRLFDLESATLFDRNENDVWQLVARVGVEQRWHRPFDPSTLVADQQAAIFDDARDVPGIGWRLAALGCARLAVFAISARRVLVLDSRIPGAGNSPRLEGLPPAMAAVLATSASAQRAGQPGELVPVARMAIGAQRLLRSSATRVSDLAAIVRHALDADEAMVVVIRENGIECHGDPKRRRPESEAAAYAAVETIARQLPVGEAIRPSDASDLAEVLGMKGPLVTAAFGDAERLHLVLTGWRRRRTVAPEVVNLVASISAAVHLSVSLRDQLVADGVREARIGWAYDLHDDLTQNIAASVMELETLTERVRSEPEAAGEVLETAKATIRRSLGELRHSLADARGSIDDRGDDAIRTFVQDIARRWRLRVRVAVAGDVSAAPPRVVAGAQAFIREALVGLARTPDMPLIHVRTTVSDNAVDVAVSADGRRTSALIDLRDGLGDARGRVESLGGTVSISEHADRLEVAAHLPLFAAVRSAS